MLGAMPRAILILLLALAWPAATCARTADAPRIAQLHVAKVTTAVATLRDVHVRLAWRAGAPAGELQVDVGAVDAPDLGYRYRDLRWQCPLSRAKAAGGSAWRCEGAVRSGRGTPLRLSIALDDAGTSASLRDGRQLTLRDYCRSDVLSRLPAPGQPVRLGLDAQDTILVEAEG